MAGYFAISNLTKNIHDLRRVFRFSILHLPHYFKLLRVVTR